VENYKSNPATAANILCVGIGWFPKTPGGLDRYMYELTHQLAASQDRVELCGVGLPETEPNSIVKLTNLAEPEHRLWKRLWLIRSNFLQQKSAKPDAINLHFALYSLPLLQVLPRGVPVTFSFHGPWALESKQEGAGKLSVFLKHWIQEIVYRRLNQYGGLLINGNAIFM
jgi:glycosyltransferase involved in cell wall biosynthesis